MYLTIYLTSGLLCPKMIIFLSGCFSVLGRATVICPAVRKEKSGFLY